MIASAESPDWLKQIQLQIKEPSVTIHGSPAVRAIVLDQPGRTLVHLLNLNVQRISSFEDKVNSAAELGLTLRVPSRKIHAVRMLTADKEGTSGGIQFSTQREKKGLTVEVQIPRLQIASILIVE